MAESGCLKDGNFQNLQAQQLQLATSTLSAPLESSGKLVVHTTDAALDLNAADHANSIVVLAKTPTQARLIKLPALSTMKAGEKIVFVVAEAMANHASNTFTIQELTTADTNKIIGCVTVVTGGDAATGTNVTNLVATHGDAVGVTNIILSEATASNVAGAAGSVITLTCVGNATKYWLVSGIMKSLDPNSTGAGIFT